MTSKKQLKVRVRGRMAKTGESYTTALRHVAGTPPLVSDHGYTLRGGLHPETANIANVLANHRIRSDGREITEAAVLGVSGGLGAGYILWEFKRHDFPALTLGFRNQGQYPDAWTKKTLDRLGVRYRVEHTAGAAGAARRLSHELAEGRPCIVRPDRYHIGYWGLPEALSGFGGHDIVVYAEQAGRVHVDDRNLSPLTVRRADLDAARARSGSYKNSLYVIDPEVREIPPARLRAAIEEGLRDEVAHLGAASDSFSLPAWRKWARMMTDTKNAKAWPKVFASRRGLAGALASIWEGALPLGMTGGNLRDLYAEFLTESADLLGRPELAESAAGFRTAAQAWQTVADIALPDSVPEFVRLRELTTALRESVADPASSTPTEADHAAHDLWELRTRLDRDLPLDDRAVGELFAALSGALADVYKRESDALARLRLTVAGVSQR